MTRTNAYSILCVFVRVFALYMLVRTLAGLPADYSYAMRLLRHDDSLAVALAGDGFELAVGAALWIFADKIARLATARPQQIAFESTISASEWQAVAFSVLGAWLCVDGFVYGSYRLARLAFFYSLSPGRALQLLPEDFYAWLVSDAVRMVTGIALMFGARGLAKLLGRYRAIGAPVTPAATPGEGDGPASGRSD